MIKVVRIKNTKNKHEQHDLRVFTDNIINDTNRSHYKQRIDKQSSQYLIAKHIKNKNDII